MRHRPACGLARLPSCTLHGVAAKLTGGQGSVGAADLFKVVLRLPPQVLWL